MAKKRIYEIAKSHGIESKILLDTLKAAGVDAKTASSSVDEAVVADLIKKQSPAAGEQKPAAKAEAKPAQDAKKPAAAAKEPNVKEQAPTKSKPAAGAPKKGSAPAATKKPVAARSGRRRVIIDAQASKKPPTEGAGAAQPPQQQQRKGSGKAKAARKQEEEEKALAAAEDALTIKVPSGATVKEVAEEFDVPVPEVIKKLMELGEMATLTQTLSDEAIEVLAGEFDKEIEITHIGDDGEEAVPEFEDAEADLRTRPPVVTIMGHVDHGKTSLLDAIRETEVVTTEAGGITQHIGAYQVHHADKLISFLDTPGHEAFTAMRARGAKVTDIAIIVVAADDGVMPQTEEAIDHAKAAGVPIMVAVNKIDKPEAKPDLIRSQLAERGLQPEDWGGETIFVDVSAKAKQNLDTLLDMLLLIAEVEDLKANPLAEASGTVIESKLDPGRGSVVTVLIQRGTLRVGDAVVAGPYWGRVRAMYDYLGHKLKEAVPGDPVEILGFDGVPEAGEFVSVAENDRKARQIATEKSSRLKAEALARQARRKMSLDQVFALAQKGQVKELNLVLKADVSGSLEAVEDEIAKLPQDEVSVNVIHRAVGGINESDIMLASASDGIVLGFNVRPVGDAALLAEREGVEIRSYSVIYKAIEELRAAMSGMLEPEEVEEVTGEAEVRQVFKASRVGTIAGSYVTDGQINRGDKVRIIRDGTVIYDSTIAGLRRFKDDVREVAKGYECGIVVDGYSDVKEGDIFEVYKVREVERELA